MWSLSLSLKMSFCTVLTLLVTTWDDELPACRGDVRGMTQVLWRQKEGHPFPIRTWPWKANPQIRGNSCNDNKNSKSHLLLLCGRYVISFNSSLRCPRSVCGPKDKSVRRGRKDRLMNTWVKEAPVPTVVPVLRFPGLARTSTPWIPSLANFYSSSKTHRRHCIFQEPSLLASPLALLQVGSSDCCTCHNTPSICPIGLYVPGERSMRLALLCVPSPFFPFALYTVSAHKCFLNEWMPKG